MNTTNTNTVFDTPSYSQASQFESTGIRELTLEEIDLVSAATASEFLANTAAGAASGAALGAGIGLGAALVTGGTASPFIGIGATAGGVVGFCVGAGAYIHDKLNEEGVCTCSPCACGI